MKKLPIFIALDFNGRESALAFVDKTKDYVMGYKLGPRLFLPCGPGLIDDIKRRGDLKVFLDFKFFDIPSSTLEAVQSAFKIGADFATVHASAGEEALSRLAEFEKEAAQKRFFQILFVTVLSSEPDSPQNRERALALADQVFQKGLRGLVCSPYEAEAIRGKNKEAFIVTPGIRKPGDSQGDQKRVMTPQQALREGASALVMGRSLIEADEPVQILKKLREDLNF